MSAISKFDKKVWENYISHFEKFVLLKKNSSSINTKQIKKEIILKNNKSFKHIKNLKNKNLEPEINIDLHGYTLNSAKLLLQKFVSNCYEKNIRNLLIITGKGQDNKGALKQEVPKWLSDKYFNKYLVSFKVAPRKFGGEGALLVRIKNKYKKILL